MQSSRVRLMLVALFAVFAFGAVGTAVAQATEEEAPYWSIEGTRLLANKTHYITAKAVSSFVLAKDGLTSVTCTVVSLKEGVLLGSEVGFEGKNNETIEFKTCTVAGSGNSKCTVEEPIVTNPILSELVYTKETKNLLTLFKPATGAVFVTLKFKAATGGKCFVAETQVEGETLSERIEDKENPKKSYILRSLGSEQPEEVLLVENKISKVVKVAPLRAFGGESTLTGEALILLAKKNAKGELETESKEWSALTV